MEGEHRKETSRLVATSRPTDDYRWIGWQTDRKKQTGFRQSQNRQDAGWLLIPFYFQMNIRYVCLYSQADLATSIQTVLYNTHNYQFLCFVLQNILLEILNMTNQALKHQKTASWDLTKRFFDMENIKIMDNDDNWLLSYGTWLLIFYTLLTLHPISVLQMWIKQMDRTTAHALTGDLVVLAG